MAFPTTLYVLLKNLVYLQVDGAASVTLDGATNEIDVYDLETYRNLLDAGTIGRAWQIAVETWTGGVGGLIPEGADDRLNAIPPFPLLKRRTMIIWWSGAAGTGDKVAMCWSDQFIGYAAAPPKFVQ